MVINRLLNNETHLQKGCDQLTTRTKNIDKTSVRIFSTILEAQFLNKNLTRINFDRKSKELDIKQKLIKNNFDQK